MPAPAHKVPAPSQGMSMPQKHLAAAVPLSALRAFRSRYPQLELRPEDWVVRARPFKSHAAARRRWANI